MGYGACPERMATACTHTGQGHLHKYTSPKKSYVHSTYVEIMDFYGTNSEYLLYDC
jgi:hypothetical protein